VQDRPPSRENANAADGDRGALSPSTYDEAGAGHKIYPYLLRGIEITRPNQVWAMADSARSTDAFRRLRRGEYAGKRKMTCFDTVPSLVMRPRNLEAYRVQILRGACRNGRGN
jgi:hypothetical protein